jgi:hypothetical protein
MYKSLRPRWCAASSPQGSRHCPRRGRQAGRSGASADGGRRGRLRSGTVNSAPRGRPTPSAAIPTVRKKYVIVLAAPWAARPDRPSTGVRKLTGSTSALPNVGASGTYEPLSIYETPSPFSICILIAQHSSQLRSRSDVWCVVSAVFHTPEQASDLKPTCARWYSAWRPRQAPPRTPSLSSLE